MIDVSKECSEYSIKKISNMEHYNELLTPSQKSDLRIFSNYIENNDDYSKLKVNTDNLYMISIKDSERKYLISFDYVICMNKHGKRMALPLYDLNITYPSLSNDVIDNNDVLKYFVELNLGNIRFFEKFSFEIDDCIYDLYLNNPNEDKIMLLDKLKTPEHIQHRILDKDMTLMRIIKNPYDSVINRIANKDFKLFDIKHFKYLNKEYKLKYIESHGDIYYSYRQWLNTDDTVTDDDRMRLLYVNKEYIKYFRNPSDEIKILHRLL